jgi:hypothetical protein
MEVKHVEAFGDYLLWYSKSVHIRRHKNSKASMLVQQASGFDVVGYIFHTKGKPM